MENELYHHGVRGMKWGVRRYQNYDGTYTKAGLKRFNKSLDSYEKADLRYKTVKSNRKIAPDVVSKGDLTNAKLARKEAKRRLDKDYRHLKQDKMADQGKEMYAKGKTITGNKRVENILSTVGSIALGAAVVNHTNKVVDDNRVTAALAAVGAVSYATAAGKASVDAYQNNRLRAYYGHTSKY